MTGIFSLQNFFTSARKLCFFCDKHPTNFYFVFRCHFLVYSGLQKNYSSSNLSTNVYFCPHFEQTFFVVTNLFLHIFSALPPPPPQDIQWLHMESLCSLHPFQVTLIWMTMLILHHPRSQTSFSRVIASTVSHPNPSYNATTSDVRITCAVRWFNVMDVGPAYS